MNITVKVTEDIEPALWSCGYAQQEVTVTIDKTMPLRYQEESVIHEILECYCKFLDHDKIIELTSYIQEGLKQLRG